MGMSDGGFTVEFDGKKNTVLRSGIVKEYPIGGMAAEYARLRPTEIKEVILQYDRLEDSTDTDALDEFFLWFDQAAREKFGLVTSGLMCCDFLNIVCDIKRRTDDQMTEYCDELDDGKQSAIKEFIFRDTQWAELGRSSVGQILLTAYFEFAMHYANARVTFDILAADGGEENQVEGMFSLYGENISLQHIDYNIMYYGGKFQSLYTFNSALSLILFEAANCMNNDVRFVKCPVCGHYFVPEGRSDTLYCSFPSPKDPARSCQEIGAQVTRANKEKNDVCTREYRKLYMRLKMGASRHPGEKKYYQPLEDLTAGNKEWKKKLAAGIATVEDYLEWLAGF